MKLLLLFVVAACLIGKYKYTSQQKKQYKDFFFLIYVYAKTKTIVSYHLCHCLRETRLS